MLDAEKPDFVVFSGDQLNGQGTSWDARSVLAKFAKAVTQRGIPWAAVFGNHDDEDGDASVRALLCKPRLFLDVLANVDALEDVVGLSVGLFELFEDDGGLVAWMRW